MKIPFRKSVTGEFCWSSAFELFRNRLKPELQRSESGTAVLVVIGLLGIMAILLAANARVLNQLKGEIKLIEKKQQQKFERAPTGKTEVNTKTNSLPQPAQP